MKEALTNPHAGYYTTRDTVFGAAGDFVTAPEVSQILGELVGVWAALEWTAAGSPPACRIVEVGPGRGTLVADMLRGVGHVPGFLGGATLHLVEVSPTLRAAQWATLGCGLEGSTTPSPPPPSLDGEPRAVAHAGGRPIPVRWHASLATLPPSAPPTLYIAHEFVDALPVHQFVRVAKPPPRGGSGSITRSGPLPRLPPTAAWRERLVDVRPSGHGLRWVLAPGDTPASRTLLPRRLAQLGAAEASKLDALELCPAGAAFAADLAYRVASCGGSALIMDYGRGGSPYGDSLVALRSHGAVPPLAAPGTADLSARVDFGALGDAVADVPGGCSHGPITQAVLLGGLGLTERLHALADAAPDDAAVDALVQGATRLVAPDSQGGMGDTYVGMAITPVGRKPVPF